MSGVEIKPGLTSEQVCLYYADISGPLVAVSVN